jgi:hypothetical protein
LGGHEPTIHDLYRSFDEAGQKRREPMRKIVAANGKWDGSAPHHRGQDDLRRAILPRLAGVKLERLMSATGLTKGACSKIRSGKVVPHMRHWLPLEQLISSS